MQPMQMTVAWPFAQSRGEGLKLQRQEWEEETHKHSRLVTVVLVSKQGAGEPTARERESVMSTAY